MSTDENGGGTMKNMKKAVNRVMRTVTRVAVERFAIALINLYFARRSLDTVVL